MERLKDFDRVSPIRQGCKVLLGNDDSFYTPDRHSVMDLARSRNGSNLKSGDLLQTPRGS